MVRNSKLQRHEILIFLLTLFMLFSINTVLGQTVTNEEEFADNIQKADQYFDDNRLDRALYFYESALKIKPSDEHAKRRIKSINELLDAEKTKNVLFEVAITSAEKWYKAEEYRKAKIEYENALRIDPSAQYPKDRLAQINKVWSDPEVEAAYAKAILQADNLFARKNYRAAKVEYLNASDLKPHEQYPLDRIIEINEILSAEEELDNLYTSYIQKADNLLDALKYEEARGNYNEASIIKPSEGYPKQKIEEIDNILAQKQKKRNEYETIINLADNFYIKQEYTKAKTEYLKASRIMPDERYPLSMIGKIDPLLEREQTILRDYELAVSNGEEYFNANDYNNALASYEKARELKPQEQLPVKRIEEINALLSSIQAAQENYLNTIAEADRLFSENQYINSKEKYKKASAIKPEENYPREQIAQIDIILSDIAKNNAYTETVASADQMFEELNYTEAKAEYNKASGIKPEEEYPKQQIAKIDDILAQMAATDKAYSDAIAEADLLFSKESYQESILKYREATEVKPGEQYPKTKIEEINTILAGLQEAEESYNDAIANADKLFSKEDYHKARSEYERALTFKPGEPYPAEKIGEIDNMLATIAQTEADYNNAIKNGDEAFNQKDYTTSRQHYTEALAIKQNEKYPSDRIKEIDDILLQLASIEDSYNEAITRGDQEFTAENYNAAIGQYEQALSYKPDKAYPQDQINTINKLIADSQALENAYSEAIASADKLFDEKSYNEAKSGYTNASSLKPEEEYPLQQIAEIDNILAQMAATDKAYSDAIAAADRFLGSESYREALSKYREASDVKPDEQYPKTKIDEINTILAGMQEAEESYNDAITNADKLFSKEDYQQALTEYERALTFKPGEPYPADKISEIDNLLAAIAQTEAEYNEAIKKGDDAFNLKDYDISRQHYTEALAIKQNEKYPSDKIKEIDEILSQLASIDESYSTAITNGDQAYAAEKYSEAIKQYEQALSFKPDESYPKKQINTIKQLIADSEALENAYSEAIANADKLFDEKSYNEAKSGYTNASSLKPEEDYPKQQIVKIDDILAQMAATDKAYSDAIADADLLFSKESYREALSKYREATDLKPEEQYPKTKIDEINTLLAGLQEAEESYNDAIANADKLFSKGDYQQARSEYERALTFKPGEPYPAEKIGEIDNLLATIAQTEADYNNAIKNGDEAFNQKDYTTSRQHYTEALAIKQNEKYPSDRIKEIDDILLQLTSIEDSYNEAITRGDQEFTAENYNAAIEQYEQALSYKPDEAYPQDQINTINKFIADSEALENAYIEAIASADKLFDEKSYNEAKSGYTNASSLKPEEDYPKQQIVIIDDILAQMAATDKAYNDAIAAADQFFGIESYREALSKYREASEIKPEEAYPKTKIAEINTLLAGMQANEDSYNEAIASGDSFYNRRQYNEAKEQYIKALELKPDEAYPADKIEEIDNQLASLAAKEKADRDYQNFITEADRLYTAKTYVEAKSMYQLALGIKPEETYPASRIRTIDGILSKRESDQKRYDELIATADAFLNNKNYMGAKSNYQDASDLFPDNQYPKDKLAEIEVLLADQLKDQQYEGLIADADAYLEAKKYDEALGKYQSASEIKPEESYPKEKINEIGDILLANAAAMEKAYNDAIASGDRNFNSENYRSAKSNFEQASRIKPSEDYPKQKIAEIESILLEMERVLGEKYRAAVAKADDLYAKKILDEAIAAYRDAKQTKPDETYPDEMILTIRRYINDHSLIELTNTPVIIENNTDKTYNFAPIDIRLRKNNYIVMKARALEESNPKLYLSYGKDGQKSGGVVLKSIREGEEENEYIIRVSAQDPWYRFDNNWLKIYSEGGTVEISSIQISQGD